MNNERITIDSKDTLESVVYTLLAAKARGEHVYCIFEGHEIHSDIVTIKAAKRGMWYIELLTEEAACKAREKKYAERVQADREQNGHGEITLEKVVSGLKFIAEHQSIPQEELIDGLLALGCNFTWEDCEKQFPKKVKTKLFRGIRRGNIVCGVSAIVNMRDSEVGRLGYSERFLSVDNRTSIYHFIKVASARLKLQQQLRALSH